jgi:carbon monoxide dehydrogenase subunit G
MISLSEEITIPSPPADVWPLLRDPALVASCIPGATLTAAGEGGSYQGTIRVKFGPTVATFRGEARLAYDDAMRRCTIEGRGIDGRGASRALASGMVTAIGAEKTILNVEGSFNVTGPLETFANAGGIGPRIASGVCRQHGSGIGTPPSAGRCSGDAGHAAIRT